MNTNNLLWVLGHKIRLLDTDESYGMIEVTSPPQVPGPPPHFHKTDAESQAQEKSWWINCSKCVEKLERYGMLSGRLRALDRNAIATRQAIRNIAECVTIG